MKQFTALCIIAFLAGLVFAEDKPELKKAFVDGNGEGWRALTAEDFTRVNSADDTWRWKDGVLHCTGRPVSVMRTKK
ncbi:MAG: DUF1080 domain-containing protein, partial [Planctomycetes bacterium]|nr:DUF1080 domain-containing protein [Planctomycetota bacterium]